MQSKGEEEKTSRQNVKSIEAETVVSHTEAERRHLTTAEKRKRNETLAIGLSRTDLMKSEARTDTGDVNISGRI